MHYSKFISQIFDSILTFSFINELKFRTVTTYINILHLECEKCKKKLFLLYELKLNFSFLSSFLDILNQRIFFHREHTLNL